MGGNCLHVERSTVAIGQVPFWLVLMRCMYSSFRAESQETFIRLAFIRLASTSNAVVQLFAWCHVRCSAMLVRRLCAVFVSSRTYRSQLPLSLNSTMRTVGLFHSRASVPVWRCMHGGAHTTTALPAFRRRPPTGQAGVVQVCISNYIQIYLLLCLNSS